MSSFDHLGNALHTQHGYEQGDFAPQPSLETDAQSPIESADHQAPDMPTISSVLERAGYNNLGAATPAGPQPVQHEGSQSSTVEDNPPPQYSLSDPRQGAGESRLRSLFGALRQTVSSGHNLRTAASQNNVVKVRGMMSGVLRRRDGAEASAIQGENALHKIAKRNIHAWSQDAPGRDNIVDLIAGGTIPEGKRLEAVTRLNRDGQSPVHLAAEMLGKAQAVNSAPAIHNLSRFYTIMRGMAVQRGNISVDHLRNKQGQTPEQVRYAAYLEATRQGGSTPGVNRPLDREILAMRGVNPENLPADYAADLDPVPEY